MAPSPLSVQHSPMLTGSSICGATQAQLVGLLPFGSQHSPVLTGSSICGAIQAANVKKLKDYICLKGYHIT